MPMQAFDWIQILQPKPEVRDTASKMLSRRALKCTHRAIPFIEITRTKTFASRAHSKKHLYKNKFYFKTLSQ
jgi:hypothetical protein